MTHGIPADAVSSRLGLESLRGYDFARGDNVVPLPLEAYEAILPGDKGRRYPVRGGRVASTRRRGDHTGSQSLRYFHARVRASGVGHALEDSVN